MKLSVVISVHNQVPLAKACYRETRNNASHATEFVIIDNGSTPALKQEDFPNAKIVRNKKNIGVYPTFQQGMFQASGDIVAFFHSDVVIWQKNWDINVQTSFHVNDKLGLLGFVGSDEIDWHGGRGGGTASGFMGNTLVDDEENPNKAWKGSPAEAHGKLLLGYMRGAVVDGCVMILRRDTWNKIGYRKDFPPHHFYDRLISTQVLEIGEHVGILGVAFDHISGQTVNQEPGYADMGKEWFDSRMHLTQYDWRLYPEKNIDSQIYEIAERLWLTEYRDIKHIVPIKI